MSRSDQMEQRSLSNLSKVKKNVFIPMCVIIDIMIILIKITITRILRWAALKGTRQGKASKASELRLSRGISTLSP